MIHYISRTFPVIVILSIFGGVQTVLARDNNGPAMIVLDASGSMWGQIGGKTKIEIARDVLSDTVNSWDINQNLGLMAYGHNRKGDCDDIEVLVHPSKVNPGQFSSIAKKLNPKGKTPLSAAVKAAALSMKYTEEKATVILISDGKETCNMDPCVIGDSLEEMGFDFTAHIIGFDISKEDSLGLRCMAERTGGAYIDAKDANQLTEALRRTRSIVTDTTEDKRTVASVNVPIEVFAGASFDVDWSGPKNGSDYLEIRSNEGDGTHGVVYIGGDGVRAPTQMTAPEDAGTYLVHYSLKDKTSLASAKLSVITPEASVDAPDSAIAGQEFSVAWTGPKNEYDSLRIFDLAGKSMSSYAMLRNHEFNSPSKLTAPIEPGEYSVEYRTLGKKILANDTITVIEAAATVKVPSEVNVGAPFDVQWTGPQNEYDRLRILDQNEKRTNSYEFVHKENTPATVTMTAPGEVGEYFVAYDASSEKIIAKAKFMVLPVVARVSGPTSVAAESEYEVTWHGPNYKGDSIYTFSAEGKDMREYEFLGKESSRSPIVLKAPKQPGKYELRYRIKGNTVLATHSFTVH